MHATATNDTIGGMPPRQQPQAMTPTELRDLMRKHGHNNRSLAELLGVHRNTVARWLNGKPPPHGTNIDQANALLIRTKLKAKKN